MLLLELETLSVVISYLIITGSVFLKIPQIVKILRAGSTEGISLPSIQLECLAFSISTSWGINNQLDFKNYGESTFIFIQLVFLSLCFGFYAGRLSQVVSVLVVTVAFGVALATGMAPLYVHKVIFGFQIVISLASRIPQIYINYKKKQTGQLSFLTFFLAGGGSCARVFTILVNVPFEKGKSILFLQSFLSALLNLVIVFQIILYRAKKKTTQSARTSTSKGDTSDTKMK